MALIEYHLSQFRQAGKQLSKPDGLSVADFKRIDTIREAAATALALEVGIIAEISVDGRLTSKQFQELELFIRKYELCDREEAA